MRQDAHCQGAGITNHIPGTLHLRRHVVSSHRCDLLHTLLYSILFNSRVVHGRSSMYPSLNAGYVRMPVQVMGISEVAENLFSDSVEVKFGNAEEIVDVTGSPPHAFARNYLRPCTCNCPPQSEVFSPTPHLSASVTANATSNPRRLIASPTCCMWFIRQTAVQRQVSFVRNDRLLVMYYPATRVKEEISVATLKACETTSKTTCEQRSHSPAPVAGIT